MQFIADDSQMYNLQTQLRSTVIDSWVKVTLCLCACVCVCVCYSFLAPSPRIHEESKQI